MYLMGHSMGSISVANAGVALAADARIKGIVLSSSVVGAIAGIESNFGRSPGGFSLERIKVPVLIMHHHDDACPSTPFAGAQVLRSRFIASAGVTFVEVRGGSSGGWGKRSDWCGLTSTNVPHMYHGVEDAAADAIMRWAAGEEVPRVTR